MLDPEYAAVAPGQRSDAGEGRRRSRGGRGRRDRSSEDVGADAAASGADGVIQGGPLASEAFVEAETHPAAAATVAAVAAEQPVDATAGADAASRGAVAEPAASSDAVTSGAPHAPSQPSVVTREPAAGRVDEPVAAAATAEAHAPAPAPAATPAHPAAPAPAPSAAPYVLPLDGLQAVAESAGLQWVNSDVDKVRQVQTAMAAESAPVRVPRERPPVAEVDDGPLVLVETKKDLSQVRLPFEQAARPGDAQG